LKNLRMRGLWDNEKADCSEEGRHDEGDVRSPSPAKMRLCDEATDGWLAEFEKYQRRWLTP
jgi:hypothetical protein